MPTAFPTGIDSFPDPAPTTPMNTPGALEHDIQHSNVNDAINTIEMKLGINGSADVNSVDKKLATVVSAQAADAAAIAVANGNISTNTTNITNLLSSNPAGAANGVVFIPATATAGTEINSAIASFGGTKGVVQLGKGTFTVDVNVPLADNVTIRGMGRSSTFLVFTPASVNPAFGGATTPISRVRLENLRIQSATDGSGTAIDFGYVNYGVISGVDVGASSSYPNKGIDFSTNNATSRPYYNVMRDCYVATGGASPIGIDLSNQANSNVIDNVRCDMPGSSSGTPIGVRVGGASQPTHSILIMHLDVESVAAATGVLVTNSSYNVTLVGCYFEAINKCIQIDSGCTNVKGIGVYMYNFGANNVLDNSGATGGDISIKGLASIATGAGSSFPFNYHSASAQVVFTASGSLTAAQAYGASALRVRVVGGGGASGGCVAASGNGSAGGGGGGGAYAESTIPIASITFPVTVTVGAGGTAGGAGASGGAGVASSFAALVAAGAGGGGSAGSSAATLGLVGNGGAGGVATAGQIQLNGSDGQIGMRPSLGVGIAGQGGASGGGYGGTRKLQFNNQSDGAAGYLYGGGASGGVTQGGVNTAQAGAAGGAGIVIVELIFS